MSKKGYQEAVDSGETPNIEMPPIEENNEEQQVDEHKAHLVDDIVTESHEVVQASEQQEQPRVDNSENIRVLREKAKSAERFKRERDELMQQMQAAVAVKQKESVQKADNSDTDILASVQPDDLIEGKHLAQMDKKYRKLEEQLASYQRQSQETNIETRLKAEYPDLYKVVSKENIEKLKSLYPEIAASLHSSSDMYNKYASTYTLLKQLGIYKDTYSPDRERAISNTSKPRPLASVSPQEGDSPLSHANAFAGGLTDELKSQLRKEMADAIKRR